MAIVQNVETVLLADSISNVSQTALEQVSQFYDLDIDNLKAELKVFTNLLKEKEKEHGGITAQGEGDKGYKRLCNRRKLMAEDRTTECAARIMQTDENFLDNTYYIMLSRTVILLIKVA